MQISNIKYQYNPQYKKYDKNYTSSFKGVQSTQEKDVSRHLRTHTYCYQTALNQYLGGKVKAGNFVGSMPYEWVQDFDKSELQTKTQEVADIFSEFAKNTYSPNTADIKGFSQQLDNLQEKLSKTLGKKLKVSYIDKGGVGKAFKIETDNKAYVLKTFHSNFKTILSKLSQDYHGNNIELANALFAETVAHKDKYVKFYMGSFETKDTPGYMLTEFLPKPQHINKSQPQYFDNILIQTFLDYCDGEKNRIGNTIIDYGGIYIEDEILNPKVRKIVRTIAKALDGNDIKLANSIVKSNEGSIELQKALKYAKRRVGQKCKITDFIDKNKVFPKEVMDIFGFAPDYRYESSRKEPDEAVLKKLNIEPEKIQYLKETYHKHSHDDYW